MCPVFPGLPPLLYTRNIGTSKGDPGRTRDTYPYIFCNTVRGTPADHGTDSAVFSVAQRAGGHPGPRDTPLFFFRHSQGDTVRKQVSYNYTLLVNGKGNTGRFRPVFPLIASQKVHGKITLITWGTLRGDTGDQGTDTHHNFGATVRGEQRGTRDTCSYPSWDIVGGQSCLCITFRII